MDSIRREPINGAADRTKDAVIDIKSTIQDAGKQAVETAKHVGDTAKKAMNDLTEAGKETFNTYASEGKKQLQTVEEYVREYPVRSLLLSAAAGIVISKFLSTSK